MSYQNRNEIPLEYKWKTEDIFATPETWEEGFLALVKEIPSLVQYKGTLTNKENVLKLFLANDELGKKVELLYCYAYMGYVENSKDTVAQTRYGKMAGTLAKINEATAYITPELSALPNEMLEEMAADKAFSHYDQELKRIIRAKAHVLSENEEKLLAQAADVTRFFQESFTRLDNGELDFGEIEVEGKPVKLSHGTYSLLLQNKDQNVRKAAFERFYKSYIEKINTITAMYEGNVKNNAFTARARKFGSAAERAMFYENVDKKVYENLIESINNSFEPLHDYIALRKKILGLETLNMYDLYVPIFENADISVPYEQAYEMVLEGLQPLGKDYADLLKRAKKERWLDVYETPGKQSGAFSLGVYGVHPFVKLNYQQTTHDIFTLAHELGHSMHSYFSSFTQPYAKNDYTIFVAEVASTVNEVLLLNYLLKKEKDENIKKYLLSYYLDMLRTTMYRQAMFAEFEYLAHQRSERGEPLSSKLLSDDYYELNKKYYGPALNHNDEIRYEWARIPHFYRAFYVYKYSTGITSAVCIAQKILAEGAPMVEKYKKFLSLGGSTDPVSELKVAGVDLTGKEPFEIVRKSFAETLAQLKELCK